MPRRPGQIIGLVLGIVAFAAIAWIDSPLHHIEGYGSRPAAAAAVTALMAIWWISEAFPIAVTACVPLLLYPVMRPFEGGVGRNLAASAEPYVDPYIFLFMGGMCIAAAMQQCDLHRRIALTIMLWIGTGPRRLLLGVLIATAFVSMWISNTATAAMMVPIALAIVKQTEARLGVARLPHYGAALMLAVAYAANLGGIATKIGTAPNAQLAQFLAERGIDVTFLDFLAVGVPFVALMLPVAWWFLWRVGRRDAPRADVGRATVQSELRSLGPMTRSERVVFAVFLGTAALWVAGKPLHDVLAPRVAAFAMKSAHVEGGTAMLAALLLLVLRADGRRTLEFRTLTRVPWHTLLLLGGAFSMAEGVKESGLSGWLGLQFEALRALPPFGQTTCAALATVFLSAFASNTATIGVMLNVLVRAVSPESMTTVLFAATIASSCDFALPAGTPPNAIVFGSGYVTVPRMAKTGAALDVVAGLVAAAWCTLVVRWLV